MNKVLFLSANDQIGGVSRPLINLSREFKRRGWTTRTVFPDTPKYPDLEKWCLYHGIQIEPGPAVLDDRRYRSKQSAFEIWRFIMTCREEIINLHYGTSFIPLADALAVRLAGKSCVASVYGAFPLKMYGLRVQREMRFAARLCRAVTVLSNWSRSELLGIGVSPKKIHVIAPGLHPPEHLPEKSQARSALGLASNVFVVSTYGRLVREKGMADLIEAVGRLSDPRGELRLVIAGYGPERSALEQLAKTRLGSRALFIGHQDDTSNLYGAADVFALATRQESFGIVFAEAAFHGVPSIGTYAGGVPDTIRDGQTGLLVPPGDLEALAGAIRTLWENPALRRRLGESARARARTEFTETTMANHYEQVLTS